MSGRKNGNKGWYAVILAVAIAWVSVRESAHAMMVIPPEESEKITGTTVWSEDRSVEGTVSVEAGATLTIPEGVTIEMGKQGIVKVSGTLRIEGSVERPVRLRKNDKSWIDTLILVEGSGQVFARNADISGGGSVYMGDISRGAVEVIDGGALDIEGANFHENSTDITVDEASSERVKIWRSAFSKNEVNVIGSAEGHPLDLRYNWWGRASGPALCSDPETCDTDPRHANVIGAVDVSDRAQEESFHDPVILIPGILGSWRWTPKSELVLDPLFGGYDALVETFEQNGYTEDVDMFPFPYEWRESNVDTALLLKKRVKEIQEKTKWPRVDIVAHSMGGLVAREYIEEDGGADAVDQLITLGTPEAGSPESYLTWEGGEFTGFRGFLAKEIFTQEAKENGYENVFDYVRRAPILSVRELLPTSAYLRDKDTNHMRSYPDDTPRNPFLERLNAEALLTKLEPVSFSAIVGKTNDDGTINTLRVEKPSIEIMSDDEKAIVWGHGKPDGYDAFLGDRGLELGGGDGTVPMESAKGIPSDTVIEMESTHGDLPTKSASRVYHLLTGKDAEAKKDSRGFITEMLAFFVYSPVDIEVVSPSGKKVGKEFSTEKNIYDIPSAYSTGFNAKSEFITIPNPEKGTYRVLTEGTDTGSYRIKTAFLQEGEHGEGRESSVILEGATAPKERFEHTVTLAETGEVVAEAKEQKTTDTIARVASSEENGDEDDRHSETRTRAHHASDNKSAPESPEHRASPDETPSVETATGPSPLLLGEHTSQATENAENAEKKDASCSGLRCFVLKSIFLLALFSLLLVAGIALSLYRNQKRRKAKKETEIETIETIV